MILPIDLHTHSTASDGVLTPDLLIERAHEKGVKVLALTDHDTVEGILPAMSKAQQLGVHLVSGIEVSCLWEGATIHILGYGFAEDNPILQELIARLYQVRWDRAHEISEKLARKGLTGLLEGAIAFQQETGTTKNAPGRPHFAEAMLRCEYVRTYKEAFQRWLGQGKIGDVKQYWPEMAEVVKILIRCNAWVSLAHPYHYNMTRSKLCRLMKDFISCGGQSIEVVNAFQAPEQIGKLANLARDFGFLVSAGSDFHRPHSWSELGLYRPLPKDLPLLYNKWSEVVQVLENN